MVWYIINTQPSLDAALYNVKKLVAEKKTKNKSHEGRLSMVWYTMEHSAALLDHSSYTGKKLVVENKTFTG